MTERTVKLTEVNCLLLCVQYTCYLWFAVVRTFRIFTIKYISLWMFGPNCGYYMPRKVHSDNMTFVCSMNATLLLPVDALSPSEASKKLISTL